MKKKPKIYYCDVGWPLDGEKQEIPDSARVEFVLGNGTRLVIGFELDGRLCVRSDLGVSLAIVPQAGNTVCLVAEKWK
jgi:hypothetical protein